jgi:hypothetical protein
MMGKFLSLEMDLNSVFASPEWVAEGVSIYPVNVEPEGIAGNYCRFSIVPSDDGIPAFAQNANVSGVVMIEIYTAAGKGPRPATLIADKLDKHLQKKYVGHTQFLTGTVGPNLRDRDNPTLYRAIYQIPFNHFGVS